MSNPSSHNRSLTTRQGIARFLACLMLALSGCMLGCEVDSFFDQSKTGRFERYPTMIPVLERLDVIEQQEDYWSRATSVQPEDLMPSDLSYVLYPGDIVTVSIFELYEAGRWFSTTRQIDAGGYYRVPELGDVTAAGLSPQAFEDQLIETLRAKIVHPQVDVVVEQASGLRYTIYGYIQGSGMFSLRTPDLRLVDALAIAGGVPLTTERIYIIRSVPLSDELAPRYLQPGQAPSTEPRPQTQPDIEEMIEQLERDPQRRSRESSPPTPPPSTPSETPQASPGMVAEYPQDADQDEEPQEDPPTVDIDDLEPVRTPQEPPVDVDVVRPPVPADDGDSFIYIPERGEWVRVRGQQRPDMAPPAVQPEGERRQLIVERVIEIDYQRLQRGDSSLNIIIRPNDRIYIEGPPQGFVYIDGEVIRPGVYSLPNTGKLTLSRFVTTAGGLGPVAVGDRVDLTRVVGRNREAKIRLDLSAIRNGTEPDILMKPDDHIIIGTTWWATPVAILRNGFRATYGFGFLLDRNFGDDVFGEQNPFSN